MKWDLNYTDHSGHDVKSNGAIIFVLASLAIYWAMWPTTAEVILIIILGLPIYFFYEYKMNWKTLKQIGGSMWIIVYLILLACMSFIGSKEFKGINLIHYPYDFLVIIVLALVFIELVLQATSRVYITNALRRLINK